MTEKEAEKAASKAVISELLQGDGRKIALIAKDLDITKQRLGNYKNGKRFPDADFVQKWKNVFGQNLMDLIDARLGRSTIVSRETEKHTPVKESNGYNKMDINRDEVYKTIVEGHTEYVLVPRDMMKDTQIVSNTQLAKDKAYMDALIEFNRDLLAKIPNVSKVQKG